MADSNLQVCEELSGMNTWRTLDPTIPLPPLSLSQLSMYLYNDLTVNYGGEMSRLDDAVASQL